jgi:four helix bundle protein
MKNILKEKSIDFAAAVLEFSDSLKEKKMFEVSNQLIRSASSIGANIYESEYAESQSDLLHKLKISEKEASETQFWLELCSRSKHIEVPQELKDSLTEIKKILGASVVTIKKNLNRH